MSNIAKANPSPATVLKWRNIIANLLAVGIYALPEGVTLDQYVEQTDWDDELVRACTSAKVPSVDGDRS